MVHGLSLFTHNCHNHPISFYKQHHNDGLSPVFPAPHPDPTLDPQQPSLDISISHTWHQCQGPFLLSLLVSLPQPWPSPVNMAALEQQYPCKPEHLPQLVNTALYVIHLKQ